jgi:hypothetical protein
LKKIAQLQIPAILFDACNTARVKSGNAANTIIQNKNALTVMKIIFGFFILSNLLCGQSKEVDRLIQNELKMTFPSVYFKNKSTDYAPMPYTADSCFKYIANNIEYINSMALWRDSSESIELAQQRIKKIKDGLRKHIRTRRIRIKKISGRQKISSYTIYTGTDSRQVDYLLSLNSVLDVSALIVLPPGKKSHGEKPRWWCRWCWERGLMTAKIRAWRKRNFDK